MVQNSHWESSAISCTKCGFRRHATFRALVRGKWRSGDVWCLFEGRDQWSEEDVCTLHSFLAHSSRLFHFSASPLPSPLSPLFSGIQARAAAAAAFASTAFTFNRRPLLFYTLKSLMHRILGNILMQNKFCRNKTFRSSFTGEILSISCKKFLQCADCLV